MADSTVRRLGAQGPAGRAPTPQPPPAHPAGPQATCDGSLVLQMPPGSRGAIDQLSLPDSEPARNPAQRTQARNRRTRQSPKCQEQGQDCRGQRGCPHDPGGLPGDAQSPDHPHLLQGCDSLWGKGLHTTTCPPSPLLTLTICILPTRTSRTEGVGLPVCGWPETPPVHPHLAGSHNSGCQPGGGAHSDPRTRSSRWTEPLGAGSRGPGHQGADGGGGAGHLAQPSASGRGDTGQHRALPTRAVGTGPVTVRMRGRPGNSGRRLTRKQPRPRKNESRLKEIHPQCRGKGWPEMGKRGQHLSPACKQAGSCK